MVACVDILILYGLDNPQTSVILCDILDNFLALRNDGVDIRSDGIWDASASMINSTKKDGSLVQQEEEQDRKTLCMSLLGAMTRACLTWPAQIQPALGLLMEHCWQTGDRALRHRVMFLQTLLKVTAHSKTSKLVKN